MEHIELFGALTKRRNTLNRRCSSANNSHRLVSKLIQATFVAAAGVLIIPATRMKGVPFKLVRSRNTRQSWAVCGAGAKAHIPCLHCVTAIGGDDPERFRFIPSELSNPGLKHSIFIKVKVFANTLGVLLNLWCKREAQLGDVACLFKERQIAVRLNIALGPGISIPVPGAAKIGTTLDNTHILNTGLM